MRQICRGWRRKIGLVTLIMAAISMAGWLRSRIINDFVAIDCQASTYRLGSYGGVLNFIRETPALPLGRFLHIDSFDEGTYDKFELWESWSSWNGYDVEWRRDWNQFHFGAGSNIFVHTESYIIPYWSIVIPLTLLSAYLILWVPRIPITPTRSVDNSVSA